MPCLSLFLCVISLYLSLSLPLSLYLYTSACVLGSHSRCLFFFPREAEGLNLHTVPIFVDVDSSEKFTTWKAGVCLPLTASRTRNGGHYLTTEKRKLTVNEMLRLQGIAPRAVVGWADHVSSSNFRFAIGNAMSGNVLQRIIPRALYCAGLLPKLLADQWLDKKYRF